jgi:uncharacterized protein
VTAAIALFDKGATVPFVARYRKDETGRLSEGKLERIEAKNIYYTALINRRNAVLENVEKEGRMTEDLRAQLNAVVDPLKLEDLYLPFKKSRRASVGAARTQGLEPLAEFLWEQEPGPQSVEEVAATFVNAEKSVDSVEAAMSGARQILSERVALNGQIRGKMRALIYEAGIVSVTAAKTGETEKSKYETYEGVSEQISSIAAEKLLTILRGARKGALLVDIQLDDTSLIEGLFKQIIKDEDSPFAAELKLIVSDAYKRLLRPVLVEEVMEKSRLKAEDVVISGLRSQLDGLLMSAPVGKVAVMGVAPRNQSGTTLAVVDGQGNLVDSTVLELETPVEDESAAGQIVLDFLEKHGIKVIGVGNRQDSRDAGQFISSLLRKKGRRDVFCMRIQESSAMAYAASEIGQAEFPDIDPALRCAISIARRLQDPLCELCKLDPRSVLSAASQYTINQRRLKEALDKTMTSCVNRVGCSLNHVSFSLLQHVSAVQPGAAKNIVAFCAEGKTFTNRKQLLDISGIGEKSYEQCVGFLRIEEGDNPLDATRIHPAAYGLVEGIAERLQVKVGDLVGQPANLKDVDWTQLVKDGAGQYTLQDVRRELEKPGRDPRPRFQGPRFSENVGDISDLKEGMVVEGIVTNVTNFGAFVDIGVQQDGLIHLSELANRFVRDPRELVKAGETLKVQVSMVDKEARRISLSRKAVLRQAEAKVERTPRGQSDRTAAGTAKERPRGRTGKSFPTASQNKASSSKDRKKTSSKKSPVTLRTAADGRMNTDLADQLAALKDKFK